MKILFASDIHGSLSQLRLLEKIHLREEFDQIVLLGDLMYHGPRNPLPEGYDPAGVASLLNQYKDKIIAIRGNCDSEVDQMLLEFPIMADSSQLFIDGRQFFLTHGHVFSADNLPPLAADSIFVSGHTHVPVAEKLDELILFNPGSISLPKEDFKPSYGVYENGKIQVLDFQGLVLKELVNW